MLSSFRVLDLTDENGFLCGKMLADMGADAIKVERPGGDPSRRLGPFYHDTPHPEKSLFWFAFNANKRGITLDIETRDGQALFKKLAVAADFVVESFPPGYMDDLGLGYAALSAINRRIILTSISHFGASGPYRYYNGSDLVDVALGGLMYVCGDADRAPLRIAFPQAALHGSAEAAVGTLVAHYHRETTGQGQHVDVSIHESQVTTGLDLQLHWSLNRRIVRRAGPFRHRPDTSTVTRYSWPCKDGYVTWALYGGAGASLVKKLMDWVESEGMSDDFLKAQKWAALDMSKYTQEMLDRVAQPMTRFFMSHTKAELMAQAIKRGVPVYPVFTAKDILQDRQLATRDFWIEVEHPELGDTITYPGSFVKASQTPCSVRRRAPLIGEHNLEVYEGDLGLSRQELVILKQAGVV
ncbi:MAG: CoA transferase [Dehalococcoidia bacterium]|nr:CoA transferase [Dehalococcoidia bacterium]